MSAKIKDKKNRWRNKQIGFRVSPEESILINKYAKLSGLSKQDYLISKVLCKDVVVMPSSRTYKALKQEIQCLIQALEKLEIIPNDDDLLDLSEHILNILVELKK